MKKETGTSVWGTETADKRKKTYFFIMCIVLGIGVFLWFVCGRKFTHREEERESISQESVNAKTDFSLQIPASWDEEVDLYHRIDAVITVPERITRDGFRSASAETKWVNQEGVLLSLEAYYHPQKGIEDEQVIQYTGEDHMYLYFYQTGDVSLTSTLRDYIFMAYHEELTEDYNRDQYPVDQALDNFTLQDCDERLRDFCDSIGMEGEVDIVHRSLDYKTMEKEARELHPDGTRTRPDYPWTCDDNSYYCTFSQTCNDIPIIPAFYLQAYGDVLNASGHTCLLNQERLISFYLTEVYDIQYGENYENLMEFTDILERYRQYVRTADKNFETVVTDITMRAMVLQQEDGSEQVTPIWIFYGYWKNSTDDVTGSHAVFINAVTGERL